MSSLKTEFRTVTELDHVRIHSLVRRQGGVVAGDIAEVIDNADLVRSQEIPANVVTMYSQVLVADVHSGEQRTLTLCYPADTDPAAGFISVLSPVGSSLLGLPIGAIASWTAPDGTRVAAQVQDILFQPEASGDYVL
ncbi:GreA/GreB family elongation factor [Rhodoferax sediminis]|jgi:regulator of nucleoside diphosphate kinase|uniref:Transcription elongation factor GreAB n=1 Tax=Rhodoferax sediminis TaxID=2509614 RepID=A0A515DF79_9BURK|nr:GreA/GreB family elongation factor [Rhodoferax sediminis]QDL39068.1 transcription elongation factor GreAB [Rhodoferax sediminis]